MKRPHKSRRPARGRVRNVLAICTASAVVAFIHWNCDPVISGADPEFQTASVTAAPRLVLPPPPALPEVLDADAAGTESDEQNSQTADVAGSEVLRGRMATLMNVLLLKQGCANFERIPDYSATLHRQERIGGDLRDPETLVLKLRHEPYSVYMKWKSGDAGRQLIYVDGQNEGKLLVQPGGFKGRLTGVLSLDPSGSLAMSECRYPVTKAGLLELARTVLEFREADLERGSGSRCEMHPDQMLNDRPCYLFIVEYDSPEVNSLYRKTIVYVDKELQMPTCVRNYTWGRDVDPEKIDEETLIEYYCYTDIEMNTQLADADFDAANRKYRLRVRR
ncbi:hypothetical protein Mal4_10200 [Maioricimonas rarisocia]|uniref:DUF1571 domain-containing protein n=1 Tax=Maioricimonas rarisocia TaxID=2528026 RepID=A0A517Z2L3_9PLAN|nr:DUF1571 domain-containing protein [Maioricimonas rarisocia]QDU36724.1 hypothetical protein Mal4_10200 [Maioricimonas rarisocia]